MNSSGFVGVYVRFCHVATRTSMSEIHLFLGGCQDKRAMALRGARVYAHCALPLPFRSPTRVTVFDCESTNTQDNLNILSSVWRAGCARHFGFAVEKWSVQSVTPASSPRSLDELLTTQQRRRDVARLGAYSMHAQHGSEPQRKAFQTRLRRYEQQIDPTGDLARRNPQELARRVDAALKADMARVRLGRATQEQALREMLARTPANDLAQVGAIVTALALNNSGDAPQPVTPKTPKTPKTPISTKQAVASVEAETTALPRAQRKHPKSFSSDGGGKESVARTPRRRQTSPDNSPEMPSSKKAAKHHHDHHNNTSTPASAPRSRGRAS